MTQGLTNFQKYWEEEDYKGKLITTLKSAKKKTDHVAKSEPYRAVARKIPELNGVMAAYKKTEIYKDPEGVVDKVISGCC